MIIEQSSRLAVAVKRNVQGSLNIETGGAIG
jgi:hypothetical protein